MTTRTESDRFDPVIESRDDLLAPFVRGEKPKAEWRIGTEHEKFVYRIDDHRAPSWDEPGGIRDLLNGLTEFGWEPVLEESPSGPNLLALRDGNCAITLEPAGQFELSGAPLRSCCRCSAPARPKPPN